MRILIDTIPRWSGGYLVYLKGILTSGYLPNDIKIYVHCTSEFREALGSSPKQINFIIDDSMPVNPILRRLWRSKRLLSLVETLSPDVLYFPDGFALDYKKNFPVEITTCFNLQPFLRSERKRLSFFKYERLRLEALRRFLISAFAKADGVIFESEFAREVIFSECVYVKQSTVIPPGILESFRRRPEKSFLSTKPVLLYVSDFYPYKYQWNVLRVVNVLRRKLGIDLHLHLVGRMTKEGRKLFEPVVREIGHPSWLQITHHVPYKEIPKIYQSATLFIYASTVETFSNPLLEAMAAGLPIAYSNRRPMTDILGEDGITFEPEDPESIADAVMRLIKDDDLRYRCAYNAYQRSLFYSWQRTARETFEFIRKVAGL